MAAKASIQVETNLQAVTRIRLSSLRASFAQTANLDTTFETYLVHDYQLVTSTMHQDHVWVVDKSARSEWIPLDPHFLSLEASRITVNYFALNDNRVLTLDPPDGASQLFEHAK